MTIIDTLVAKAQAWWHMQRRYGSLQQPHAGVRSPSNQPLRHVSIAHEDRRSSLVRQSRAHVNGAALRRYVLANAKSTDPQLLDLVRHNIQAARRPTRLIVGKEVACSLDEDIPYRIQALQVSAGHYGPAFILEGWEIILPGATQPRRLTLIISGQLEPYQFVVE